MSNLHFLAKLGSFFRDHLAQMSELTEEDIKSAIKEARAHSGGMQKAENMKMSEAFGHDGEWKLFMEQTFAEPPASIQVLPKAGAYSHPKYGKFTMTPKIIQAFVDNHNNHVYQEQVPIDAEHQSKLSGAIGYYGEMHVIDEGRGGAEASVNWTDRGRELIASDAFQYFSPEWFDEWTDPTNGKKIANVLVGGAITTRPFFKDKAMRPLVASEDSYQAGEWDGDGKEEPRTLTMSAMQFAESSPDDDEEDEDPKTTVEEGDAHVNTPVKIGGKDKESKANSEQVIVTPTGGRKMADEPVVAKVVDEATKAFVENETKQLTEKLESETGLRKAAEERLVKLETEAQTRRFTDIIMGHDPAGDGSPPFAGKHEMHNSTLSLLAKEFGEDSEQFKEYVSEQRAVAKSMREAGMFKEVGKGSAPGQITSDGAIRRFDDAVAKWQSENSDKSKGEAIEAVARTSPKLYTESVREKDRIAKSAPTSYGYAEEDE